MTSAGIEPANFRFVAQRLNHCATVETLKHVIEGKIEGTGRWGRGLRQLLDDLKETRRYCRGSNSSHSVENSPFKRLWTCLKVEYVMMESSLTFTYSEYLHYTDLSSRDQVKASLGQSRYRCVMEEKSLSPLPRTEAWLFGWTASGLVPLATLALYLTELHSCHNTLLCSVRSSSGNSRNLAVTW